VVDEDVERTDKRRRLLDLGDIGDVERQWRDALVAERHRAAHRRVNTLGAASHRLVDECSADAAVRAGDQYCLVFNLHNVLLGCHYKYGRRGPEDTWLTAWRRRASRRQAGPMGNARSP